MFHNKQLLFSIKLKCESLPVRHYSFHADSHILNPLERNPAEQLSCQNCRHITLKIIHCLLLSFGLNQVQILPASITYRRAVELFGLNVTNSLRVDERQGEEQ